MTKIAILGGSGYTAAELIKLLLRHPGAKIEVVTSLLQLLHVINVMDHQPRLRVEERALIATLVVFLGIAAEATAS